MNSICQYDFIDKPLKQAVHCKTQEEWDFVTDKLGYKWTLVDSMKQAG